VEYFRAEYKIGMLVFVSLASLLVFVLGIGSFQIFQKTKEMVVYFVFVDGLEKNAPVRYSGVKIGKVKNILISDKDDFSQSIKVILSIGKKVKIDKNVKATVNTLGLMGEKYIELIPVSDSSGLQREYLKEGECVYGESPVQIAELIEEVKEVVVRLKSASVSLDEILNDEDMTESIKATVKNAQELVAKIKEMVANNEQNVEKIIYNIVQTAENLDKIARDTSSIIGENRQDIRHLVENFKETSHYAKLFAEKIEMSPSSLFWKSKEEKRREQELRLVQQKEQKSTTIAKKPDRKIAVLRNKRKERR
jgi:phospholipid/cholesterol/gamma-HCH transport system substrate-binding protein